MGRIGVSSVLQKGKWGPDVNGSGTEQLLESTC